MPEPKKKPAKTSKASPKKEPTLGTCGPSPEEVRLRIVEKLIPVASMAQLTEPQQLVKKATELERYILSGSTEGENPLN